MSQWAEVAGTPRKVKYLVATLPYSNVYFAKAYPLGRHVSRGDGGRISGSKQGSWRGLR